MLPAHVVTVAPHLLLFWFCLLFCWFAVAVIDHSLCSNSCSHHLLPLGQEAVAVTLVSLSCFCSLPPVHCCFLQLHPLSLLAALAPLKVMTVSTTYSFSGTPLSLATAGCHCHQLIVAFSCYNCWHCMLCWHQSHSCFYKRCCHSWLLLL